MSAKELVEQAEALETIGDYMAASYKYMKAAWQAREEGNIKLAVELVKRQNDCMYKE